MKEEDGVGVGVVAVVAVTVAKEDTKRSFFLLTGHGHDC